MIVAAHGSRSKQETHLASVCKLLQSMPGELRHEMITTQFSTGQRLALENFMLAQRARKVHMKNMPAKEARAIERPKAETSGNCCDSAKGIRQGVAGGFFAETQFQSLRLTTRVSSDLEGAQKDHRLLTQIFERVRGDASAQRFSAKVRVAVAEILGENQLDASSFLRAFCIEVPSHHWLGCKLKLYRNSLDGALDAWERLSEARGGVHLFSGGQISTAYTAEMAQEQWTQLKDTYMSLCIEDGRKTRDELVADLANLESRREVHVSKASAHWQQRQETLVAGQAKAVEKLRSKFDDLVYAWECAKSADARKAKNADARKSKTMEKLCKKRRWDEQTSMGECQQRNSAKASVPKYVQLRVI